MRICVCDGGETIGGNKIYVQLDNRTGFFFDFGNNFYVSNQYFHDYLTERSVRGINTYVELGLIPRLKIYRSDLIPVDLDVSGFKEVPVGAVLLSHAHADHAGMVGVLREDIASLHLPSPSPFSRPSRTRGSTTSAPTPPTTSPGKRKTGTSSRLPGTRP